MRVMKVRGGKRFRTKCCGEELEVKQNSNGTTFTGCKNCGRMYFKKYNPYKKNRFFDNDYVSMGRLVAYA